MARIRTVKPDMWMSPQVMNLSFGARLLFIGLITQADDQGRGIGDPRRLKAAVFPADEVTVAQVSEWFTEIVTQMLAVSYEDTAHGRLFFLPSWFQHQVINKPKPSAYPPCPGFVPDDDGTDPVGVPGEGKGREGKGKEQYALARATLGLDTKTWERWLEFRVQLRKPIKPASAESAAKALAAYGSQQAAVVEQSIANGWQGLFALKTPAKPFGPSPKREREPTPDEIAAERAKAAAQNNAGIARALKIPNLSAGRG